MRYSDLSYSQNVGIPPSWICGAHFGTNHEEYTGVFITVQNLVGIAAVFSYESLNSSRVWLKTTSKNKKLGHLTPKMERNINATPTTYIRVRKHVIWRIDRHRCRLCPSTKKAWTKHDMSLKFAKTTHHHHLVLHGWSSSSKSIQYLRATERGSKIALLR